MGPDLHKPFINFVTVVLVGGSSPSQGNIYATNPVTKIFGPVCSDGFDNKDVSFQGFSTAYLQGRILVDLGHILIFLRGLLPSFCVLKAPVSSFLTFVGPNLH